MITKQSQEDILQDTIDQITAEIEDLDIQREVKVERLRVVKQQLIQARREAAAAKSTKFEKNDRVELIVEPLGFGRITGITKTGKSAYVELEGQDRTVLKRITSLRPAR